VTAIGHAFDNPAWLAGRFSPPRVRIDNPRIVHRHMRSFLLQQSCSHRIATPREPSGMTAPRRRWLPLGSRGIWPRMVAAGSAARPGVPRVLDRWIAETGRQEGRCAQTGLLWNHAGSRARVHSQLPCHTGAPR